MVQSIGTAVDWYFYFFPGRCQPLPKPARETSSALHRTLTQKQTPIRHNVRMIWIEPLPYTKSGTVLSLCANAHSQIA